MDFKKTKGITIIALIITVIVLLILLAVTVTGIQKGLMEKAGEAVRMQESAEEKTILEKIVVEVINESATGSVEQGLVQSKLNNEFDAGMTTVETIETNSLLVTFNESGRKYKIDNSGKISLFEN